MCGIAGSFFLSLSALCAEEDRLCKMRDLMAHRGPDGAGIWISADRRVGLAHRRLSIVDLSTNANQPMGNEDAAIQLVFNGEIYNHADLRRELLARGGHVWRTDHSDTETIVHAYEQWGTDCFTRFRGMFAIGLWDGRKRELILARDRVGLKPLYYVVRDGAVHFASEIKALLGDPAQPRKLDEESLFHYLSFLATPPGRTLFAGIRKLPAACWLRIREDGTTEERRYWDPLDQIQPRIGVSEEKLREELLAELKTSVGLRKMSDVPVGVFLSGGLDSTLNAVLFSEGERTPVHAFSVGFEGSTPSNPSELPFARIAAQHVGAKHFEIELNQQHVLDLLPRMIAMQDEPLADPVCVPVYYVAQLAREHGIKVCQVGEGADELFLGYAGWQQMLRLQQRDDIPGLGFAKAALRGWLRRRSSDSMAEEWLRRSGAGRPLFWGGAEAMTHEGKLRLFSAGFRSRIAGLDSWSVIEPIRNRFLAKAWEQHPLHWMTYVDLQYRLPELLHMRLDKMTMALGLEAREPFMDHKLIELAMSIPAAAKIGDGTLKYLLKRSVRDLIPAAVLNRPKQGFGIPVTEWLQDRLGRQIESDVMDFARSTDLFDPGEVAHILREKRRGIVWTLMNLAMWWKHFGLSH